VNRPAVDLERRLVVLAQPCHGSHPGHPAPPLHGALAPRLMRFNRSPCSRLLRWAPRRTTQAGIERRAVTAKSTTAGTTSSISKYNEIG
jgi:hypothetical protein